MERESKSLFYVDSLKQDFLWINIGNNIFSQKFIICPIGEIVNLFLT